MLHQAKIIEWLIWRTLFLPYGKWQNLLTLLQSLTVAFMPSSSYFIVFLSICNFKLRLCFFTCLLQCLFVWCWALANVFPMQFSCKWQIDFLNHTHKTLFASTELLFSVWRVKLKWNKAVTAFFFVCVSIVWWRWTCKINSTGFQLGPLILEIWVRIREPAELLPEYVAWFSYLLSYCIFWASFDLHGLSWVVSVYTKYLCPVQKLIINKASEHSDVHFY